MLRKYEKIKNFLIKQKIQLIVAFGAVFVFGLIAHGFGFLNLTISHDSLCEFFVSKWYFLHKIELGRFMVPVYQYVFHARVALPWLNGLLALLWLSISVWLTAYLFSIKDKLRIIILAGIYTVNITVISLTATYINELDADMFAVMLAVFAAILWKKNNKLSWIGIPIIVVVLGLYQSMLSVYITLIMMVSIIALLQGEKASKVVLNGLKAICIIFLSGIIYLILTKVFCIINGIELTSDYNGLTNLFKARDLAKFAKDIFRTYTSWIMEFLNSSRTRLEMLLLHVMLFIATIISVLRLLNKKGISVFNKVLVILLGIILPIGMNLSCAIDGGMVHDLMMFAVWFTYLLVILINDLQIDNSVFAKKISNWCRIISMCIIAIILVINIQTANNAYVKKDLERQATLSFMTNVNYDMNKMEGYVAGKTEVVFLGFPQTGANDYFSATSMITGLYGSSQITWTKVYDAYFKYVLQVPILQSEKEIPKEFIDTMEEYPKRNYIKWYNDILVVNISK